MAIAYLSQREDPDAWHTAELVEAAGHRCATVRGDPAAAEVTGLSGAGHGGAR